MPSLTTVTLLRRYAFRKKKTIHTKSASPSSPSFLDITPALQHYLSFSLSYTIHHQFSPNESFTLHNPLYHHTTLIRNSQSRNA